MKSSVPFNWRLRRQRYLLAGSKCLSCGRLFFPARKFCVGCHNKRFVEFRFSGKGVIESYTTIYSAPTGFAVPYVVGIVRFDEGPKIAAQIITYGGVNVGDRVAAVFRKLSETDRSGVINYGLKFEVIV